jgi:hypothetical protein
MTSERPLEIAARACAQEIETRYEPQRLATAPSGADPYSAWLARRELERERDSSRQVRWVYRPPGTPAAPERQVERAGVA